VPAELLGCHVDGLVWHAPNVLGEVEPAYSGRTG
jgi:hypothetical protein